MISRSFTQHFRADSNQKKDHPLQKRDEKDRSEKAALKGTNLEATQAISVLNPTREDLNYSNVAAASVDGSNEAFLSQQVESDEEEISFLGSGKHFTWSEASSSENEEDDVENCGLRRVRSDPILIVNSFAELFSDEGNFATSYYATPNLPHFTPIKPPVFLDPAVAVDSESFVHQLDTTVLHATFVTTAEQKATKLSSPVKPTKDDLIGASDSVGVEFARDGAVGIGTFAEPKQKHACDVTTIAKPRPSNDVSVVLMADFTDALSKEHQIGRIVNVASVGHSHRLNKV